MYQVSWKRACRPLLLHHLILPLPKKWKRNKNDKHFCELDFCVTNIRNIIFILSVRLHFCFRTSPSAIVLPWTLHKLNLCASPQPHKTYLKMKNNSTHSKFEYVKVFVACMFVFLIVRVLSWSVRNQQLRHSPTSRASPYPHIHQLHTNTKKKWK